MRAVASLKIISNKFASNWGIYARLGLKSAISRAKWLSPRTFPLKPNKAKIKAQQAQKLTRFRWISGLGTIKSVLRKFIFKVKPRIKKIYSQTAACMQSFNNPRPLLLWFVSERRCHLSGFNLNAVSPHAMNISVVVLEEAMLTTKLFFPNAAGRLPVICGTWKSFLPSFASRVPCCRNFLSSTLLIMSLCQQQTTSGTPKT